MDNEEYTDLYNILLEGINRLDPGDNLQLVNALSQENVFDSFLEELGEIKLGKEITRALLNMKEDGLIRATATPIKFSQYIITFNGLTTKGHNYLSVISTPKAWRKIKTALNEAGVPLTPQSAGKFMGKLFF